MGKWPLFAAAAAAIALVGGGSLVASQLGGNSAQAAPSPAPSDENAASSAAAMAARAAIANDPVAPKYAPKNFDVTVIVYADYQCPFCRKVHPELKKLIAQDKRVRIVYRDWPIFGPASEEAARAAIASQWQGKHAAFDDALMTTTGKLDSAKIKAAALKAGVDWARLQRDLKSHKADIDGVLSRTSSQAAQMGLQGTPALLIGPYFVPGAIDYATLVKAVGLAREFNARHSDKTAPAQ